METSFFYFSDALIICQLGLKGELLTSSPTQFETFSDTARFYSSQFKGKSLVLHYRFTFCIIPRIHLNSCCTIPPLSTSDHKGLLVSLHNDGVIKRPLSNSLRTVWCYSQANFDLACDLLNESDWKERGPSWSAWTNWRWPAQDLRV